MLKYLVTDGCPLSSDQQVSQCNYNQLRFKLVSQTPGILNVRRLVKKFPE
jgi:hypothetical protein